MCGAPMTPPASANVARPHVSLRLDEMIRLSNELEPQPLVQGGNNTSRARLSTARCSRATRVLVAGLALPPERIRLLHVRLFKGELQCEWPIDSRPRAALP